MNPIKKNSKKQNNLQELDLSSFIGDRGSALVKRLGTRNVTSQQIELRDRFIKDFMGDAVNNIQQAVKGGIVDPNLQGFDSKPAAAKPASATSAPATAPKQSTQPRRVEPTIPEPSQAEPIVKNPALPASGATPSRNPAGPVPATVATTTPAARSSGPVTGKSVGPVPGSAPAASAAPAAKVSANKYKDIMARQQQAAAQNKAANKAATAAQQKYGNKPISQIAAGIKAAQNPPAAPAAPEPTVTTPEPAAAPAGMTKRKGLGPMTGRLRSRMGFRESEETRYNKLNQLFESIMMAEAVSISAYLKNRWFPNYMRGVDYSEFSGDVDKLISAVEQTYSKDKGRSAIKQLANTAFTLSSTKRGATASPTPAATGAAATTTDTRTATAATTTAATSAEPAAVATTPAVSTTTSPATTSAAGVAMSPAGLAKVSQINATIPKLKTQELQRIKKNIDGVLKTRAEKATSAAAAASPPPAPRGRPKSTAPTLKTKPVTKARTTTPRGVTAENKRYE